MNASTHDIIQTVVEKVREESQDGTVYHIRVLTETDRPQCRDPDEANENESSPGVRKSWHTALVDNKSEIQGEAAENSDQESKFKSTSSKEKEIKLQRSQVASAFSEFRASSRPRVSPDSFNAQDMTLQTLSENLKYHTESDSPRKDHNAIPKHAKPPYSPDRKSSKAVKSPSKVSSSASTSLTGSRVRSVSKSRSGHHNSPKAEDSPHLNQEKRHFRMNSDSRPQSRNSPLLSAKRSNGSHDNDQDNSNDRWLGQRVSILGRDGETHLGTVRFKGKTDFKLGEWVGVELDEAVGKNDGAVQGKRYFFCPPEHGVFLRSNHIRLIRDTTPASVMNRSDSHAKFSHGDLSANSPRTPKSKSMLTLSPHTIHRRGTLSNDMLNPYVQCSPRQAIEALNSPNGTSTKSEKSDLGKQTQTKSEDFGTRSSSSHSSPTSTPKYTPPSTPNRTGRLAQHQLHSDHGMLSPMRPRIPSDFEKKLSGECTFKVIVVGDSACGKTSIIRRFVQGTFLEHHQPTIGLDFQQRSVLWDGRLTIKLQLWDIAGQDRYAEISRAYFRNARGAIVVADVTRPNTLGNVAQWHATIMDRALAHDKHDLSFPIVLMANKTDLLEGGSNAFRTGMQVEHMARELNFTSVFISSAKENDNIDEAMLNLIQHMLSNRAKNHRNKLPHTKTDNHSISSAASFNSEISNPWPRPVASSFDSSNPENIIVLHDDDDEEVVHLKDAFRTPLPSARSIVSYKDTQQDSCCA